MRAQINCSKPKSGGGVLVDLQQNMKNFFKGDKIFVCDDKYTDVIRVLEKKGWRRHSSLKFPKAHFKWCNYSKLNWRSLDDVIVNHIYNSIELSKKSSLALHLRGRKDSKSFFPKTWVLSNKHELINFLGRFILQYFL